MDDFFFFLQGCILAWLALLCSLALLYCLVNLIQILFFPHWQEKRNTHYFNCDLAEEADRFVRSLPVNDKH